MAGRGSAFETQHLSFIVPVGLGAPGPLTIPSVHWRRRRRQHNNESFAVFLRHMDEYYTAIKARCLMVSSEELLERRTRRDLRRAAQGTPALDCPLLVAPKEEPIDVPGDDDNIHD